MVREQFLVCEVEIRAVTIRRVKRGARVISVEDLLVPLALMEAELGLPPFENGLFPLNDSLLPAQVCADVGIPVFFKVLAVVPLWMLLRFRDLALYIRRPAEDLSGFRRGFRCDARRERRLLES